jgi:hypothetical protein
MSIKNIFLAGAAATFIAGSAFAAEPVKLADSQMDDVTAGLTSLNLTLALALAGPVVGAQNNSFDSLQQTEFATVETISIGTAVTSARQAQGLSATQINSTSLGGGGIAFSAGNLTLGGSLGFQSVP